MSITSNILNLIAFPGAPNLPIFSALEQGFFSEAGVDIRLETTPSSTYQMEKLLDGDYQVAATAFDNVLAYKGREGAGRANGASDLFAFMAATRVELSLVVSPQIKKYKDLKGHSLAVDAPGTGFAFVLYDMIERSSLLMSDIKFSSVGATPKRWESVKTGEHVGTLMIEPFTSIAIANGFHVLESSLNTIPNYQGGVFAASREWVSLNEGSLMGFIKGYLRGLRWTLNPDNYEVARDLLVTRMPAIRSTIADGVMTKLLDPSTGLIPDGEFDSQGVDAVRLLRNRFAATKEKSIDFSDDIDAAYLRKA